MTSDQQQEPWHIRRERRPAGLGGGYNEVRFLVGPDGLEGALTDDYMLTRLNYLEAEKQALLQAYDDFDAMWHRDKGHWDQVEARAEKLAEALRRIRDQAEENHVRSYAWAIANAALRDYEAAK